MKPFLYCLAFIIVYSFPSIAQNTAELQRLYSNNEYQRVITQADSLINQQSGSFEVWYYKGMAEQSLSKYKEAVETYNQSLLLSDNKVQVLYSMGICQESAGNDKQAMLSYNELLSIDSLHIPSKIRMASIYKGLKEFGKAIETYSQLVQLDSTNGYFYSQLAYCCSKFGFSEPVIPYYLKAIELNPSDLRSINELINELVDKKQYEDGQYYCDSFLILYPNNIKILKQQAYISALQENSLDAVRQFAYIVSLGDTSQFTCKNYGQSLFNNGQYAESIFWLDKYLKNQPGDTKNQFIMGLACQKDYQYEKSLMHLNLALTQLFDRGLIAKVFEENGNTFSKYADYCGFRDSTKTQAEPLYNKALDNYLEAASINPDGIAIYKTIGRFYNDKQKDSKKALYYYEKYEQKLDIQKTN
jgi:tetratricopeptide (TPR) repeat protein